MKQTITKVIFFTELYVFQAGGSPPLPPPVSSDLACSQVYVVFSALAVVSAYSTNQSDLASKQNKRYSQEEGILLSLRTCIQTGNRLSRFSSKVPAI